MLIIILGVIIEYVRGLGDRIDPILYRGDKGIGFFTTSAQCLI